MQLFVDFQKEMYGREVLIKDYGFAVYKLYSIPSTTTQYSLYLHSIYVKPEKRKSRYAFRLFDEVLQTCPIETRTVIGYVDKTAANYEYNKNLYLRMGAEVIKETCTETNFCLNLEKYNGKSKR